MPIAQRGSTTTATGSTVSPACAKPTGTVAGDVVILTVCVNGGGAFTPPTGFTAAYDTSSAITNPKLHVAYRVCDGTEDATFTGAISSAVVWSMQASAFSGVDNAAPFDVPIAATEYTTAVTACTAPTIAAGANGRCLIGGAGSNSSSNTFTPPTTPTTWTELYDPGVNKSQTVAILLDDTGSSSTPTFTQNTSRVGAAWSAALKPDAGLTLTRSLSDSAQATDATVKTEGEKRRDLDDTGPAADTLTRTSARARAAGDTAVAADTTSAVVGKAPVLRSTSDTAAAVDGTARASSRARPVGDTAPAADTTTRATSRARSGTEPTAAVDTTARLLGLTRAPSDTAAAADATAPTTVGGGLTRTTAETAPAADANARTVARTRSRTEPSGPVTDTLSATRALARGIGEPTSLADLTTRARRVSRTLLDLALAGDTTQPVTVLGPVPLLGRILAARLTTPQARGRLTVPAVRGSVEAPRIAADLTAPTARGSLT